ncbi:MAG: hypothetical protein ILO34_04575, partial [Kiritimatiellae bacterium]|nr:hypothetical protein [Kiritimatiellia bacterium]
MAASALCAMLLAVAGCGNTGQREGIFVTFDMPYDGKATIVIDDAESGCRVRNLVNGLRFGKGRHEVEWDGRAEDGTGAKAGRYRARIATHRALGYDYKSSFAAGGEKLFGGFGPNHLPCEMVAPAGKRIVAAALFTEGGNSTLVLSHDGKLVNGYGDGWNLGNKACVYLPSDGEWIYSVREADGNRLEFHGYGVERRERRHCEIENARPVELKGATKIGNKVYISNALGGALDVYELREEEWRSVLAFSGESIPCGIAGPLAENGGELVLPFKENLVSMACDGKSLYTLERGSSLIHVYDLATKKPLRTIGEDGGSYTGPWRKNRLVDPRSLAFDSEGSRWVAEYRYNPKRITRWNVVSGECDYEKTGGEKYGSPGCGMDGEDPSRWIAHDAEWRYDPAKGVDRPLALLFDEKAGQGELFDLPPRQARTYKFARRDGKTFVIGNDGATTVWEYLEDEHRLKPLMMQGTPGFYSHMIDRRNTCVPMRDAYRRRFPGSDPERFRHDEETLMVWRDADGDERMQAEEFEFAPQGSGGTGGWGLFASDIDFTCLVNLDGEYALIDLEYPDYSLAKALAGARRLKGRVPAGSSVAARTEGFSAHDRRYIAPCLSPYMFGFERDGTLAWHMKNPFPGVHGSQAAPLPSPGELQGVLFALGSVPGGRRGEYEVVAMKNNHGRIFFITTDGLYIDELFSDCRVAAANDETCIGGESFGGSFEYDRRGGRAVLTSGGGGYRWYDILGLDS